MRLSLVACLVVFALNASLLAQNSEYPTLDEMSNLDVPGFEYIDLVDRFTSRDANFTPPASPPDYQLGAVEDFFVTMGADEKRQEVAMELRGITNRVLVWVQTTVDYPNWRALQLAQRLETQVLKPVEQLFNFSEPPGVDGDSRLTVVMINDPEGSTLGYFPPSSTRPKRLHAKSNQREMLVVNLALDDEYTFYDKILVEVIAHEFAHILHHHADANEETWLDEGLASHAGYVAAKALLSRHAIHFDAEDFLTAPDTSLLYWQAADDKGAKYGAGSLFILYLRERFGSEILPRLMAEPADGWRSVEIVLREFTDDSAAEVFADWVIANWALDSRRGYGYRALDAEVEPPEPSAGYNSFPATHKGELPQLSTDYISLDTRGAAKLLLRLWAMQDAQLIPERAPEGDYFAYAFPSDYGHSRLTREFVLTAPREAWLDFWIWYDLENTSEYGFVTVSDDYGRSWQTLRGSYGIRSRVYSDFYDFGFTGRSNIWRHERIDLSQFTPGRIFVSFELMSSLGTKYRGLAIDDVRIDALNYQEGFETPDDTWRAEGWIRSDNRLPNNIWLQALQETRDGLHLSRALLTGNGELTVDLMPGVSNVTVALSPMTPQTSLPTEYELEFYLLDAAGEVMLVTRECTVTTTDFLNFRDAPSGNKIGLVPQGATLDAIDRDGDWFNVYFNGVAGWVSAGYVTTAGNCPA